MKKFNLVFTWEVFVLILYVLALIFTTYNHEPWRDEAQAWLISRDLPISSIFKQMNYEGTPALWSIILFPFAKTGFPYITLSILNLIISFTIAAIFIFKSPFSKTTKILFVFSYYMFWEYSIIARNYNIAILILFILALLDNKKFKKPIIYSVLILLLFNANIFSFIIGSSLFAIYIYEAYKLNILKLNIHLLALVIMITGAVIAILQLYPAEDNFNQGLFKHANLIAPLRAIGSAFLPYLPAEISFAGIFISALTLGLFLLSFFKTSRIPLFVFLFSLVGFFYVFVFKDPGHLRHFGLILILLLFCIWIDSHNDSNFFSTKIHKRWEWLSFLKHLRLKKHIILLNILLLLAVIPAIRLHYKEFNLLFSGSKKMARYIKANAQNNVIVAYPSAPCLSILPYFLNKKFWYVDSQCFGSFIIPNKLHYHNQILKFKEIENRIENHGFNNKNFLILLTTPIPKEYESNYRLLYEVGEVYYHSEEKYYLYEQIY